MGVTNWLSPKVSNPEMELEVELKGNARAKPRFELRASVWCRRLGVESERTQPGGAEGELIAQTQSSNSVRPKSRRWRAAWPAAPDRFGCGNCPSPRAETTVSASIVSSRNGSCPDSRGREPAHSQGPEWS